MVLKTGSDKPVQPSAGHSSDPVVPIGLESNRTGIGPFEPTVRPANRTNQSISSRPNNSFSFSLPCAVGTPTITWSVVRPTTIPLLSPEASSYRQHPRCQEPCPTSPSSRCALKSRSNLGSTQRHFPTSPLKRCKSLSLTPRLQSPVTSHPQQGTRKLLPSPATAKSPPTMLEVKMLQILSLSLSYFPFQFLKI